MAQTYTASLIASTPLYQVRFLLGDNIAGKMILDDAEILWLISTEANVYMAAALAAGRIAAMLAASSGSTVSGSITRKRVGNTDISYSASGKTSKDFESLALTLFQRGRAHQTPWAGGISVSDKDTRWSDPDRPADGFRRGQFDYDRSLSPETGDTID